MDIGSTTSHLQFSRLRLQRRTSFSSRYEIAEREILHRSPIALTPVSPDGAIDAAALGRIVDAAYREAGLAREDVDTGAVILTGLALEHANAAAVAALFADEGGRFVCATAGHRLEAVLAAHGSGAVRLAAERGARVINVDVGGGTAKVALIDRGEIVATTALAVGARVALPVEAMADAIVAATRGSADHPLHLLPPLPSAGPIAAVTFSGGVGELFYGRTSGDWGDAGPALAAALRARAGLLPGSVAEPDEAIRATVVGASQFAVHLSGATVWLGADVRLPLRDVPVARARDASPAALRAAARAAEGAGPLALAVPWSGEPAYAALRSLAEAVASATERRPLVVAIGDDVARSLGRILSEELDDRRVVALDGIELADLDYVDVGRPLPTTGSVPVVVKTLLLDRVRSGPLAGRAGARD